MTLVLPFETYCLPIPIKGDQLMSIGTKPISNPLQFQSLTALNKSLARNQRRSTFDIIFERKPKNPI